MKTQTVWTFTPDEFAWIWTETGLDVYPDPISILESATTAEEYTRLIKEISARYPRGADPDLTGPLRVLAQPDLRIVCKGRSLHSPKRVRSLGAATADLGVILFQKSGPTPDFGGDIKLVVTQRHHLAKHIAATLPPSPPGAAGAMIGYTPRVRGEQPPTSWKPAPNGERAVEERIRALLRLPRTAEGHFRIQRHTPGQRPQPPQYLSWIDIRNDHPAAGRYLIDVNDNDTTITPGSPAVIVRELHRAAALDRV